MFLLQANQASTFQQLWKLIETTDQWLFLYINRFWTNSVLDSILPIYRESTTWAPLYFFLFLLSIMNFGKRALPWILFLVVTVSLTDQISSAFLKEWFGRVRPCGDANFSQYVRLLLSRCPISGSFTSSHAANHFAMAAFIVVTVRSYLGKWKWAFWFWAASISYAQVYIGVHYPLDVIGGGLVGALIGWQSGRLFVKKIGLPVLAEAIPNNPTQKI